MLRRYDLASHVAVNMRWSIFALNVEEAKETMIDRIMQTRPGLDRRKVRVMLRRIFAAKN